MGKCSKKEKKKNNDVHTSGFKLGKRKNIYVVCVCVNTHIKSQERLEGNTPKA